MKFGSSLLGSLMLLTLLGCRSTSSGEQADLAALGREPAGTKQGLPGTTFPVPRRENNDMSARDQERVIQVMMDIKKVQFQLGNFKERFEACMVATKASDWSDLGAHFYCMLGITREPFTYAIHPLLPKKRAAMGYKRLLTYREAYDHLTGRSTNPSLYESGSPVDPNAPHNLINVWRDTLAPIKNFPEVFNNLVFHSTCTYKGSVQKRVLTDFYNRTKLYGFTPSNMPKRGDRDFVWNTKCRR